MLYLCLGIVSDYVSLLVTTLCFDFKLFVAEPIFSAWVCKELSMTVFSSSAGAVQIIMTE